MNSTMPHGMKKSGYMVCHLSFYQFISGLSTRLGHNGTAPFPHYIQFIINSTINFTDNHVIKHYIKYYICNLGLIAFHFG